MGNNLTSRRHRGDAYERYVKEVSTGFVVCVEKEGAIDPGAMVNITMRAQKKSPTKAMDATKNGASYNTSETTVLSKDDIAKIKKDAEDAIKAEVK